jgi:hypothetical protein
MTQPDALRAALERLVENGPHWSPHPDIRDRVPSDPEWGTSLVAVADLRAALAATPSELDVERRRAFVNFVRQWWGDSYGFTMAPAGNDGVVADDFEDMTRDLAALGIRLYRAEPVKEREDDWDPRAPTGER